MGDFHWFWIVSPILILFVFLSNLLIWYGEKNKKQGKWEGEVNSDRELFNKFMEEMRDNVRDIKSRIKELSGFLDPAAKSNSPKTLTELGKKVSADINAKEWIERFVPLLEDQIKGKQEFEIYEICDTFIRKDHNFSEEEKALIKKTAYENSLEQFSVLSAFVIELRDRLLEVQKDNP